MPGTPLLHVEKLSKVYRSGSKDLIIFRDLELEVEPGEQIAIMGESGAGKSTLLHLIGGLDRPTTGAIYYKAQEITRFSESQLAEFRNREIGFVWQQHQLLPEFSAVENVAMPLLVRGVPRARAFAGAHTNLAEVGLEGRAEHRAGELSGGEQQRVALARALSAGPSLLLADEPTGNLDERTGTMIFDLLQDVGRRRGLTAILVTHNPQFAQRCERVLVLVEGELRKAR